MNYNDTDEVKRKLLDEAPLLTEQEADAQATLLRLVHIRMQRGIVRFRYKKKDLSTRQAYGTLAEALIPRTTSGPSGAPESKAEEAFFKYFDVQKHAWRMFNICMLLDCDEAFWNDDPSADDDEITVSYERTPEQMQAIQESLAEETPAEISVETFLKDHDIKTAPRQGDIPVEW